MSQDAGDSSQRGPGRSSSDVTDEWLVDAIIAGDRAAFETLFERYCGRVHNLCRRILRDDQAAEDAVIDVFAELWRIPERFKPQRGSVLTYLLVLARCRALDRRRSQTATSRLLSRLGDIASVTASGGVANDTAIDDPRFAVLAAFDRLEPKCQEAVRLCIVEGLTSQQAARTLGEPVGTIKSRIRKSIIRMHELIRTSSGSNDR
jgi:RNA polymerase sigma-70 factor (ECF subfamily)